MHLAVRGRGVAASEGRNQRGWTSLARLLQGSSCNFGPRRPEAMAESARSRLCGVGVS